MGGGSNHAHQRCKAKQEETKEATAADGARRGPNAGSAHSPSTQARRRASGARAVAGAGFKYPGCGPLPMLRARPLPLQGSGQG